MKIYPNEHLALTPKLCNVLSVGIEEPQSNHITYTKIKLTKSHKYMQTRTPPKSKSANSKSQKKIKNKNKP